MTRRRPLTPWADTDPAVALEDPPDLDLRVASILRAQGREGAAVSVLQRARSTLAELGVPLPEELRDLDEPLVELP